MEENLKNLKKNEISPAIMRRLPNYLRYLKEKQKEGVEIISSVNIADDMKLSPIQVKKDIASSSKVQGKPRIGFEVDGLIADIERVLGYGNVNDAVLVGAGQLGKTLLSYTGFENYGLNIVAAFDSDPAKCNIKIKNKTVYPVERLSEIIKKYNIRMGIITVPERFAQNICDIMVEAGIKAIWNFAPTHLIVPDKVALKNEDLAASLAILSSQLKVILNKQEN